MMSQQLVIVPKQDWLPKQTSENYMHREFELFDVVVMNIEPDWPGTEKATGLVIWGYEWASEDTRRIPELETQVHLIARRFALATGTTTQVIKHDGPLTNIEFKSVEFKNVTDMEWAILEPLPRNLD